MNLHVITQAYPRGSAEAKLLVELAQRIEGAVDTSDEGMVMLANIVGQCSMRFADGFSVNDDADMTTMLGYEGAAVLCSAFRDDCTPADWKARRLSYVTDDEQFQSAYHRLVAALKEVDGLIEID